MTLPENPAACALVLSFFLSAGGLLQERKPEPPTEDRAPTPIEQALIEYACSSLSSGVVDNQAYQTCLDAQLATLRDAFGRDLSQLSPAERRALDASCSRVWATRGRDMYVACVSAHLVALKNRRNRAKPADPSDPSAVSDAAAATTVTIVAPSDTAAPKSRSFLRSRTFWIAAIVIVACAAAAAARMRMAPARVRAPAPCRMCGVMVADGGELCQKCRHEAAQAHRAAEDQAENMRMREDDLRRQREDELREQQLREEQEAAAQREREQARREERARFEEQARAEEAARRREPIGAPISSGDADDAEVEPRVLLGVPTGATAEQLRAAYEQAKARYDPDQVTHLSPEVQNHFRLKAAAIERAYEQLAKEIS